MRKVVMLLALAAIAAGVYRLARRPAPAGPRPLPAEEEPIGELSTLHAGIATEP